MLWVALPALAGSAWVRHETEHFDVFTQVGQADSFTMAVAFEQFHAHLDELGATDPHHQSTTRRLPVVVFDQAAYDQFVTGGGRHQRLLALDGPRPVVAVDAGQWTQTTGTFFGDYARSYADRAGAPLWLQEGLAAFYETAEVVDGTVVMGQPPRSQVDALQRPRWHRYEDVLVADHRSRMTTGRRRALFRAQAWLLVHWCLVDAERAERIEDVLTGKGRALDPQFFATSPQPRGWLLEALQVHYERGTTATRTVPIPDKPDVIATEAPVVVIEYRLGQLLTASDQYESALSLFQHAQTVDPGSWMPHDGLAMLAEATLRGAEARQNYAEAAKRAPTEAGPLVDHGRTVLTGLKRKQARAAARTAFESAIVVDPSSLPGYSGLADIAYRERNWTDSARWAAKGLQIDPMNSQLRAMLGRAQFAAGDLDRARLNAQLALQQCRDGRACAEAATLSRGVISREGG